MSGVALFDDRSEALEVGFGSFEVGEEALFGLELAGVDAAAAGFDADGMLEVEHLVVEEILDSAARGVVAVESLVPVGAIRTRSLLRIPRSKEGRSGPSPETRATDGWGMR